MSSPEPDSCSAEKESEPCNNGRRGDWYTSFTGRQIWALDPTPDQVCIEDIAHSLAYQCRFGGHCLTFYSIAQHSLLVARLVPERLALIGLMHDATEAYAQDIVRPIKRNITGYREIEQAWAEVIDDVFALGGLLAALPAVVKEMDTVALRTERRDLINHRSPRWNIDDIEPDETPVVPMEPRIAEIAFLARFDSLTKATTTKEEPHET
jgi:hypothetical protein